MPVSWLVSSEKIGSIISSEMLAVLFMFVVFLFSFLVSLQKENNKEINNRRYVFIYRRLIPKNKEIFISQNFALLNLDLVCYFIKFLLRIY
jgi:hypothetical protein